ncbi:hypothetical protein AALB16_04880 [Lachnospiraceae bacterium 62-35]
MIEKKKKNTWECKLLFGAFGICCGFFPLLWAVSGLFGWSRDSEEENRTLVSFPKIETAADLLDFPVEFDNWCMDHLFLKSEFVKLKSETEAALFGQLDSQKVILGTKKPWLFHCSNDGQPLETYKGSNRFTEEEFLEISENLKSIQESLSDMGIQFVLMIVPDKEQIYGECYMPETVKKVAVENRTEQLLKYLEDQVPEVTVIYPKQALLKADGSWPSVQSLYYESDTHWNKVGAWTAARELLSVMAEENGIQNAGFTEPADFSLSDTVRGDLQKMVKLGKAYDSTEYEPFWKTSWKSLEVIRDQNSEVIWESSVCKGSNILPISVYVAGDSFRWNLGNYVKNNVQEAVISSRYYLEPELLGLIEPDVFVYMIAERYLQELSLLPGINTMPLSMPEYPSIVQEEDD